MTRTTSHAPAAQRPAPQTTPSVPRRDATLRQTAGGQPPVRSTRLPDISRIPVHPPHPGMSAAAHADQWLASHLVGPENAQAAAWPARIQRSRIQHCGIGSSGDCPPHEELAAVRRDLRRATAGGGIPLPDSTRASMERAFATDFTAVRVHTGPGAQDTAAALHARALTAGTDIVFHSGAYRPGTHGGDRLLAHELAHVVQQARGLSNAPIDGGATDPSERAASLGADHASLAAEHEAHSAAALAVKGAPIPALSRQPITVARQDLDVGVPSGARRQADFAGANAAMEAHKWDEVAWIVYGFSPDDLAQFLSPLKPWMQASIYAGAIAKGLGPKSAVALATRSSYLDVNYENELRLRHWPEAAYFLNGFIESDIKKRIEALSDDEVRSLHAGAVQREDVGDTSAAALVTNKVLADRAVKRQVAELEKAGQLTLPTSTSGTAEPGNIGFISIDVRGDPGVDPGDREALEPGTDWSADPDYVDNNIVSAWYYILTSGSEFQVQYEDGSFLDLDLDKIRAVASPRPSQPPSAPAPAVTPPSPAPPPMVPRPPRASAAKPRERGPSERPRRATGYFRNRRNRKIYPDRFTAGSIPTIGWLAADIDRKQPEARAGTRDALIFVAVAARDVAHAAISASRAIERPGPMPRSKRAALDESFEAAESAAKQATQNSLAPISAQTLGKIGTTTSRSAFRTELTRLIQAEDNPLHFLLDPQTGALRPSVGRGINERIWLENPEIIEASHFESAKGLAGSADRLVVMSAYENRLISATIEHPAKGGASMLESGFVVEIGGIPVSVTTARDWVAKGSLKPELLATARRVIF
jgi:Domain of unknown function (DUF4157)/Bacterial toxin 5